MSTARQSTEGNALSTLKERTGAGLLFTVCTGLNPCIVSEFTQWVRHSLRGTERNDFCRNRRCLITCRLVLIRAMTSRCRRRSAGRHWWIRFRRSLPVKMVVSSHTDTLDLVSQFTLLCTVIVQAVRQLYKLSLTYVFSK